MSSLVLAKNVRRFGALNGVARRSLGRGLASTTTQRDADSGVPYKVNTKESIRPTTVPDSADVVVIGGGSLGCSTIYHLTKLGVKNVVLLEAHQLTAGTTWHTAGLIWSLRPNDTEIQLLNRTRDLLKRLEGETGIEPGWINNGGMFIASSKERLDEYKRLMTIGKAFGVESSVLSPAETKKMYPLMNVNDVYGVLYCPSDGTLEPDGFCSSLSRFATRHGAKVIENCPVTDIRTQPTILGGSRVTSVETPFGSIKTECVVNATGCWANDVTSMVGVDIPLVPMKHAYVVTERIEGIANMPNVRDHDASVYLRLQGDALSVGGYENNPILLDKLGKNSAFTLYDLDWDVFSFTIDGAVNRVPELEKTGIKSTVCGPESFTPDHKPIMGEDPDVGGFFHCCGFNSAGMMLSGGCGQELAHWIVTGRPALDMYGYDIRRFHAPLRSDRQWALARSHEAYAKNYAIVFPHDEPLAGRGMRTSPLHQLLEREGCVYQERHGWERPGWFEGEACPVPAYDFFGAYDTPTQTDQRYQQRLHHDYSFDFPAHHHVIKNECLTCRSKAAIFDMSYFGKYILSGKDAQKAADWLFTANVQREHGRVVYTCMLNENGGTESDLTVNVLDGSQQLPFGPRFEGAGFYLGVGGGVALQNHAHIMREIRKQNYDVTLTDLSEDMAMMSLQGPASRKILQSICNEDFSNENFPFSTSKVIEIAGHQALAIRITFPGEMGWELHVLKESAVAVYSAVMDAGKPLGLINAGYRALESLSTEKGYCHWHADLRLDDTPLEAGLAFTCKLKTDIQFLGRPALERQKREGLKKKLVTLTLDDPSMPLWGLEAICRDDQVVGFVRAAELGFTVGKTVAHGYVHSDDVITKQFLQTGHWTLECMGVRHAATVCLKPPFDPLNLRIKGHYAQIDPKLVFE